jgi:hypothetical protein
MMTPFSFFSEIKIQYYQFIQVSHSRCSWLGQHPMNTFCWLLNGDRQKKHPKVLNLLERLGGAVLTTSQTA